MRAQLFIFLTVFLFCGANHAQGSVKVHSTSTSRQFIVYGTEVRVRGAMCDLAERTKSNLLQVLGLRDNWKTPLVINLDYPRANLPEMAPSRLDFSQIGSGLKLQLNFLVTSDFNGREVQRELLRAILIEMIYRERTDVSAGSHYAVPPDWLIDGILQRAQGHDGDDAAQLLETMLAAGKIARVEEIVRQRRDLLEPASRKIHNAYSMALVQLLIDSPNGRLKLVQYIADLAEAPNDPMADLRRHFPAVLGHSSGKWWSLSVARLSASDRYEILTAAATANCLDRLLRISIPGPDGKTQEYALGDYAAFLKLPAGRGALRHLSQEFLVLGSRAHPSYRSIAQEYYDLTLLLARGKTKRMIERLARVASDRAVAERQGHEMDDYMNWFEATQLKTMSGAFSEILKAASPAEEAPARRRDAISVYLDSIEASL
ncbi:MAG: hypothetical protein H0X34_01785 [Chthoniobacterales bacterium]|nr:hypothetical protein [Chthoniobacterales bacterium]